MATGWLRRKRGKLLFCWNTTRIEDGATVEHSRTIGSARLTDKQGWTEVVKRGFTNLIDKPYQHSYTLEKIAEEYLTKGVTRTGEPKAESTKDLDKQLYATYIKNRWGSFIARKVEPAELQTWLDTLSRGVRPKVRNLLSAIYRYGQKYNFIPRTQESNPMPWVSASSISNYEALTITPKQAFAIVELMPLLERTLTVLVAVTGMRISEALGLKWSDIDWEHSVIYVRRGWVRSRMGKPKSKASRAPVPMHEMLAAIVKKWRAETHYASQSDFVFASSAMKGTRPRLASMIVQDYVRPCAVKAGVLTVNDQGETLDSKGNPITRFGFHNFRHSLATFLISSGHDPVVVQRMLRHSDVRQTMEYTHIDAKRREAQGEFVQHFFSLDMTGTERVQQ